MDGVVKLVGCAHQLQLRCWSFRDDQKNTQHRQQQSHFAQTLATMLVDDGFRFVGEEIGHQDESILELLAQAFRVRFDKIDMPMPLRIHNRCGRLYSHPASAGDFPSLADWQANTDRCHKLREEYMFHRSMEFIQETGLPALIVCGQEHRDSLAKLFSQTVPKVITVSVAEFQWFDNNLYDWPSSRNV